MRFGRLRRLGGFGSIPIIGGVSSLITLPLLTASLGATTWSAIAIGQSVGITAAIVVNYSWNQTGPRLVANDQSPRADIFRDALLSRVLMLLPMIVIAAVVAFFLAPSDLGVTCALSAVALTFSGLSPTWYFVGLGQPTKILQYDVVPKAVVSIAAAALLIWFPHPDIYPLAVLAVSVVLILLSASRYSSRMTRADLPVATALLGRQRSLTLSQLLSSSSASFAISAVTLGSPAAVPQFAAADRVRAFASSAVYSVVNSMQGWVSAGAKSDRVSRALRALAVMSAVSVVAGLGFAVILPLFSDFLFSGTIEVTVPVAVLVGTSLALNGIGASLANHVLIPLHAEKWLARTYFFVSLWSLAAIFVGARLGGAVGACVGLLVAIGVQGVLLAIGGARAIKSTDPGEPRDA